MISDDKKSELMDAIILSELYKTNNRASSFAMAVDLLEAIIKTLNISIQKVLDDLEAQKTKAKELQIVLDAWFEIFGTTQLTHASERLRAAEEKAEKFDRINNER